MDQDNDEQYEANDVVLNRRHIIPLWTRY